MIKTGARRAPQRMTDILLFYSDQRIFDESSLMRGYTDDRSILRVSPVRLRYTAGIKNQIALLQKVLSSGIKGFLSAKLGDQSMSLYSMLKLLTLSCSRLNAFWVVEVQDRICQGTASSIKSFLKVGFSNDAVSVSLANSKAGVGTLLTAHIYCA